MKQIYWSLVLFVNLVVLSPLGANETATGLKNLYEQQGYNALPTFKKKLRSGTPHEKESILWIFQDSKIIELIPAVIEAIGDPSSLPVHGDTGWGFVAHQAASSLQTVARTIDGVSIEKRGRHEYSFYDDMYKGGIALQREGRLTAVQKNWKKWWGYWSKNK